MPNQRQWWFVVIESYPCPVCGVGPGDRCLTAHGETKREPHADRTRQGDRCSRCGAQLHAESDDVLCERCALVRALEVERATKYQRRRQP